MVTQAIAGCGQGGRFRFCTAVRNRIFRFAIQRMADCTMSTFCFCSFKTKTQNTFVILTQKSLFVNVYNLQTECPKQRFL